MFNLSVHHLALNSHGILTIFLTWGRNWVEVWLPRHEVVKDEEGPGEPPARVGMGMPLRTGPGIRLPAISISGSTTILASPPELGTLSGCSLTSSRAFRESCGLALIIFLTFDPSSHLLSLLTSSSLKWPNGLNTCPAIPKSAKL